MPESKEKKYLPSSVRLKEELEKKEKEFHLKDDIFGMTLLTNPGYISSSRNIMFTSHLSQFVDLKKPDFPRVFTNYENMVGKNSTGYYAPKHDIEIVEKIPRYSGMDDNHAYLLITYDKKHDRYDLVMKKNVEDLTEKFGYRYNNEVMDEKEVGDKVKKGEVLYKTPSYDQDMNYCYGKNVTFMYMLDNFTIEDAVVVSESLAKEMISTEVETVKVSLNDNDILCNIYGDSEIYKGFPDIGEKVNHKVVCAKRRIHNNQLLYDVKKSNLRKINFASDVLSFCDGEVVDINIYSNKTLDELEDNIFNAQLIKYLKMQKTFYQRVYEVCKKIIDSGSKYSNDISYYFKRAKDILDPDYKWREEDNSVFNNMVIEFTIARDIGLTFGQKLTGRYGNKGVISKVVPDDEMPFLETGKRVDILFNTLGVINRLNSMQLYEASINFICNRVRERMKELPSNTEKEKLLLRIIWYFNEEQEKKLKKFISKLSENDEDEFFQSVIDDGIYVHIPPLWEKEPLFDRLRKLYDEFDWIKPYDVYINKFGRKIKMLKSLIVGDMYIIKLKQTPKKGFSARATGSISKAGIPEKSNKAKKHQDLYSKTPIRIGDQENINSAIGVPSDIIAQMHMFYRSSVIGRRKVSEQLATSLKELKDFDKKNIYSNRNIEIFQSYLKTLGMRLNFSDDKVFVKAYTDTVHSYKLGGKVYLMDQESFEDVELEKEVRDNYYEQPRVIVGTKEEVEDSIQKQINWKKRIKGKIVIDVRDTDE